MRFAPPEFVTYQLAITVVEPLNVEIGRLGIFDFPAGRYVYTGSARRHFEARIARHLRQDKKLRWHIDYLLADPQVTITDVVRSMQPECDLNRQGAGRLLIKGFGASDCTAGCGSHLKYLGED